MKSASRFSDGNMFYQTLRYIGFLVFSMSFGLTVTLIVTGIENIVDEKELKKETALEIENAASTFKSVITNVSHEETIFFLKKYIRDVMKDKAIVVETDDKRPDNNEAAFLSTFADGPRRIDIYIKNSYLKKDEYSIDPPELIYGLVVTLVVFTLIVVYSEKKKQTLAMQKKYETETAELTRALEEHEALALLGRMAATLAHELRTPISTISNLVQVLPQRLGDENFTKRFITLTKEELDRTQQLINNLLVYGKEISVTNAEWISFRDFADDLSGTIGVRIISCPEFKIYGDKFYMRLLLENLMRNSLQAGANQVAIEVNRLDEGDDSLVEITYEDNGSGFPPDTDLEGIINPFVTLRSKGAGLGLYLAQKIASAHNGTISLYHLAKGAGVRIVFPAKRVRLYA